MSKAKASEFDGSIVDVKRRRVFLHHDMHIDYDERKPGENAIELVVRALLQLDETKGDIELWINTPGGSCEEMFGLHDVIRDSVNDVSTVGFGRIYSAGGLILAAGTPGKRFVTKYSWFMAHLPQMNFEGDLREMIEEAEFTMEMHKTWTDLMGVYTKKTAKFWYDKTWSSREYTLPSKDVLSHGIADGLYKK